MPNKFLNHKGIEIKKQKNKLSNWSEYNEALKRRGDIEVWLSQEIIDAWFHEGRVYDGTGTPDLFTDLAIITCHEIRKVFRLPLRQCEGFINSLFRIKGLAISCPSFSDLSKRLAKLEIKCPRYRKTDYHEDDLAAIAIDSTGLKRFGRDEWHQEKHKIAARRSWRKLHIAVDEGHVIQAVALTDRYTPDAQVVEDLLGQIKEPAGHYTADDAYDQNPVYRALLEHSPQADIVIPPDRNAICHVANHPQRNRNIREISAHGRMAWQHDRNYGQRNYSELGIQRYKRILGNSLQSREFGRQKQESLIGCGVLNKMTSLGMPESYRVA